MADLDENSGYEAQERLGEDANLGDPAEWRARSGLKYVGVGDDAQAA